MPPNKECHQTKGQCVLQYPHCFTYTNRGGGKFASAPPAKLYCYVKILGSQKQQAYSPLFCPTVRHTRGGKAGACRPCRPHRETAIQKLGRIGSDQIDRRRQAAGCGVPEVGRRRESTPPPHSTHPIMRHLPRRPRRPGGPAPTGWRRARRHCLPSRTSVPGGGPTGSLYPEHHDATGSTISGKGPSRLSM